ncbi:homeobox protein 4-like [Melanaphis sacchari]|uniref:Tudor domain-containing protein 5 n=1 Tax=Melanaphis sacchari TaxID=742174 RepID=A0A2H8TF52_9HEMI|nr:homeobox protein 4-like [Melanaphis sacchari]XP_025209232.1 homeobox protein 4-like [Melanaphis sacchari]
MAVDFNEVKINVRSLLTSSQKPLSILQLQKDYREQEGCNLPYRSLGFSSVIELLQNMNDVLIVPPNPNESSTLSLIVDDKTNHLRMLIVKQKSNTKKKKAKPNMNRRYGYQTSSNGNKTFSGHSSYNKTNNYASNISQNNRNGFHRYNNSSMSHNQLNQSSSSIIKSYSNLNRNGFNQNINSSNGYVTDKLRSDIERFILENQKPISLCQLEEIVKQHSDCSILKINCMQDLKNRFKDFLNINDTSVSLKNTLQSKTNIVSLHHNTDVQIKPLRPFDFNKFSNNNTLPSFSSINHDNDKDENVINSKEYDGNKQNTVSDSYRRLTDNGLEANIPHDKNQSHNYGKNNKLNRSIESSIDYIDICKNQNKIKALEVGFYNKKKNSDFAEISLRKNIEYVKKLSENKKNKKVDTELVNGKKSESCFITINGENSLNNSNLFLHSTPKKNNNDKIILNVDQCIPEEVRLNIARIFKVYCNGLNIENFKFIYSKLYCTVLDPTYFGFTSIKQLLKELDQMIEIRNNILYSKNELILCENIDFKNKNDFILTCICLSNGIEISTIIEQPILSFNKNNLKKMLLVETYNPSLFYLQLCNEVDEFNRLMMRMQNCYETENKNYLVKLNQILLGSFYASSYTSFSNTKQWYRVRVIREINPTTVEVIHVDYGTVDNIPKTELRFLKSEFCNLPCQAIHCCLTGYNELDTIASEVTNAFLEIININKEVLVIVDDHFILNNQCQILHVTLFQNKSNDSKKLENINNELTIWHLKR